ncbi:MAG: OmpH family outer membrane protein [Saprospiraceae bacterium]|uniref:OmpH family outer membrane protein n=1 Tax=Candidatus Opimibacter skivensis TaxID=2982028 RepID=A0A9D7SV06_9BACT|nr:OmpH family outer membrane protein [Candidatus Opimibacter skivensis]
MKSILKYTLMLVLAVTFCVSAEAQKIGYVDSGSLLEMMPKVKEAESNLETLGKQLQAKGQKMMTDYQTKAQDLQRRVQAGDIAPKDQDAQVAMLKDDEAKIQQFDQDMQKQLSDKREALLAPILNEVKTAIQTVAKENGYTYIFDGSPGVGVLLYADETTNITAQVKAKLGI